MQSCWNCHVTSLSLSYFSESIFCCHFQKLSYKLMFFGLFSPVWNSCGSSACPLHLSNPSLLLNSPSVKSSICIFSSGDTPKITLQSTPRTRLCSSFFAFFFSSPLLCVIYLFYPCCYFSLFHISSCPL